DPAPSTGTLEIDFYTVEVQPNNPASGEQSYAILHELKLTAGNESNYLGEFHTIEKIGNDSTEVLDVKKVHHGDGGGDFYLGTLHDLNDNPTEYWNKHNNTVSHPILTWMAIDTMIMRHKPQIEFSGDIYQFFPYL